MFTGMIASAKALSGLANQLLSSATIETYRAVNDFLDALQLAVWCLVCWPCFMLIVAFFTKDQHWRTNIIALTALLPVAVVLLLGTKKWALAKAVISIGILSVPHTPRLAPLQKFLKLAEEATKKVALVFTLELLVGIYLALVPITNDRWLTGLLALVLVSIISAMAAGWHKILKPLWMGFIILTLIFFLGGRDKAWETIQEKGKGVISVLEKAKEMVAGHPVPTSTCEEFRDADHIDHADSEQSWFRIRSIGKECFGVVHDFDSEWDEISFEQDGDQPGHYALWPEKKGGVPSKMYSTSDKGRIEGLGYHIRFYVVQGESIVVRKRPRV